MRRWFLKALTVYALVHVYIWWRLALPLPSPWWQVATMAIPILGASFPVAMRHGRNLSREASRPWLYVGYLWFGFATYFLLGAIGSHIAVAFGADGSRAALIGAGAAIVVVVGGLINVAMGPRAKHVTVPLERLRKPYTLVQLTDVHIGSLIGREFAETLVRRVNALKPDAVVITGDLYDGRLDELKPHIEPLRGLRARDGVFAVTGNHEYYWNVDPWLLHLRSLGIRILRNEHVTISNTIQLAGTDDISMTEDVAAAVAGRDPALPIVLLAHHPRTIATAQTLDVDLQLSGHTHGGQMLPWGYLARLFDPLVSGLRRFGRTWLYVSHGTGYWGPPLRVGTRCEITALSLVPTSTGTPHAS